MQHQGPIAGIATYGDLIATAGYDNKIILWDALQRKALARTSHDHLVNNCSFSSDGKWLVSASSDYSARIWSVPSLRLHAVLSEHDDDVDMALFSPDDSRIATCALDRCVRIFDLKGHCLHTMRGHTGNVLSLAWMPDSRHLISSSVDGTIRTWDTFTGTQIKVTNLQIRTDSVEIDADGIAYAGDDYGRIAIIHNDDVKFIHAHRAGVKKIVLNEQQKILVSLSYDRSLVIWNIQNLDNIQEVARTRLPETIWARAATILKDGRIAAGTFGSTYALFDLENLTWDLDGVAASNAINAVLNVNHRTYTVGDAGRVWVDGRAIAEMGSLCNFLVAIDNHVFTGGQLGQLFNAHTGAIIYEHHSPLNCATSFTYDNTTYMAVGSYTGEILLFSMNENNQPKLLTELVVYENAIKGLSISDGLLFSVCASTDIAWHRLGDWQLIKRINKAHERITNACCALGAKKFASVGRDRNLRIWSDNDVENYPTPHLNSVKCMSINSDHTLLLTGSYGGTLALFDLVEKHWKSFDRPTIAGISSIAWDNHQKRFLAASYDGNIYKVAV